MTIRNLEGFFAPRSVALIGPSRHDAKVVEHLVSTLSAAGNKLSFYLVDLPDCGDIDGGQHSRIDDIPGGPDLAILLTPADTTPGLIARLAERGTRAVLLISPGFETWPEATLQACREAARPKSLRLIGPGSLGLAVPSLGIDTLLSAEPPAPGDIALISRSGAVLNATLSWAGSHRTGFSAVVSLGDRTDVDIGDLIDYFAQDYRTRAILLHMEGISNPRKFLSAARAAARSKPVIVIRSGRSHDVGGTGLTHAGRLASPDLVYEAAFRRAGMMRVGDLDEMFEAVETLSRIRVPKFEALTILSNGGSLASLAADRLNDLDGHLADLSAETMDTLSLHCRKSPISPKAGTPVILREDLAAEDLKQAIGTVLADPATDGVLVLQSPTAFTGLEDIAAAIAQSAKTDKHRTGRRKAIVVGLVGDDGMARSELDDAQVPCYGSPAEAVRSLMYLAHDARSKDFLMAAPPSLPADFTPDAQLARAVVDRAMDDDRTWLSPEEIAQILTAYQIPVVATQLCNTPEEARKVSEAFFETHRHCVVKLISPDLPFKSRIDGVRLGLEEPASVEQAAQQLIDQTRRLFPAARIAGVSVHPMLEDRHGIELFIGLANTPIFGPVLVFGHGGTSVEDSADVSVELPPLDLNLAQGLIDRTRIAKLIAGSSSRPALDRDAIALALVKLSQIAIDIPEILELDINPLMARQEGLLALDARVTLGRLQRQPGRAGASRLAIAPYPQEWEDTLLLKGDRKVFVRPVRPEDEDLFKDFFEAVEPEDLRLRFFAPVRDFSHKFLARLTQLDYARAMAFAAIEPETGKLLGVVRLHADPDHRTGEYAIMVRSDLKGVGLGWALMKLIIRYARADGIETIKGEVLKENTSMLAMCQSLGFKVSTSHDDPGVADVILPVSEIDETATDPT
ncbi:bifunctional acetate--CoA ligase family protein/GNAT family N-acetyltransferase [Roseibium sp.]|uniref:bifunctional acetate--CoA ligase family protein/GNAT family N-acetyltransferase n=1 Tax=Roseibium sp. TaxID=1936156 RepID=UPI003A9805FB